MTGVLDSIDEGPSEHWTMTLKSLHGVGDSLLLLVGKGLPPGSELVSVLDLPHALQYNLPVILLRVLGSVQWPSLIAARTVAPLYCHWRSHVSGEAAAGRRTNGTCN